MRNLLAAADRTAPGRVDHAQMRTANMSLIMRTLRSQGGRSRARLAADTGLSRATMTSLVTELTQRGLVREGDLDRDGTVGRPGTTLGIDPRHAAAIGVSISVDFLVVTAVDTTGAVVFELAEPLAVRDQPEQRVIELLVEMTQRCLAELEGAKRTIVGLTISAPGVIDYRAGSVRFAPNLGWRDVPVMSTMARLLDRDDLPIAMENDAKLAALAEYTTLHSSEVGDLLFLTGDVGVGAGIIASGRLVRGWNGFSGEVGHLPLDPTMTPCACGRAGCWETIVGERALLARAAAADDPVHDLDVPITDRLQALAARLEQGDERVRQALDGITVDLARGINVLIDVLNPRMVVLGGWFVHFEPWLMEPLRRLVQARLMDPGARVELTISHLGPTSSALGGAMAALERVFDDPSVMPLRA